MSSQTDERLEEFMHGLERRNPGELEFHQAVREVAATIIPFVEDKPDYRDARILERLTEPNRILTFRVTWEDRDGNVRINRGYRVQNNNAIGPYKGGLRFDRNLSLSILKFLAFEQTFKNSLTGLPMGGGKGGADFNPKGKSDREVMRFCQSFMTCLYRNIGHNVDVPAGDIGVGAREISYMFGQYKRLTNHFTGILTGKGLSFGGSLVRTEATGFGVVYFLQDMLAADGKQLEGRTAIVSGSGNVALHAIQKLNEEGAQVLTASDSGGFIHDPEGINAEKLEWLKDLKTNRRGRISEYAEEFGVEYHADKKPWIVPGELALPCATQNELNESDARTLLDNGCIAVSEGANMPTELPGVDAFLDAGILYAPSKAANAGGVAVSGLEMTQNSMRLTWSQEELNERLRAIMLGIHEKCREYGNNGKHTNYVKGANIAGFVKVADAMLSQGIV